MPPCAEKSSFRHSYDDLATSYTRSLLREEAQLATRTPPLIQLTEILEGFFLLAALTLQLIPVCYAITQKKLTERTNTTLPPKQEQSVQVSAEGEGKETQSTVVMEPLSVGAPFDMSHFSLWSTLALMVGVILSSVLRRFYHRQMEVRQQLTPDASPVMQAMDHQEMENDVARAFTEMSHLASQIEKLRTKVRVISRDYGSAIESSTSQATQFRQALQEVIAQLKGTEVKIQDLNDIMYKMQGFQSKQFTVVSSALRRLDQECKSLNTRLPSSEEPALEDNEPRPESESTSGPQKLDMQTESI